MKPRSALTLNVGHHESSHTWPLSGKETVVLIAVPPDAPPQQPPVVVQMVAANRVNDMDLSSLVGEMGSCMVSPTAKRLSVASSIATDQGMPLYPEATALRWFPEASANVDLQAAAEAAPVQIMKSAAHGTVTFNTRSASFDYKPKVGYVGDDTVVFVVDIDGRKIKVTSHVKVLDVTVTAANFSGLLKKHCPLGNDWRISNEMMPDEMGQARISPTKRWRTATADFLIE